MKNLGKKTNIFILIFCISLFFITSCVNNKSYFPKPKGYFRIDLPEKRYILFDSTCPYTFEYPVYARVVPDKGTNAEPYWINVDFPHFRGRVNISYKFVKNNLTRYAEDAYTLVMKHIPKADNIDNERIDIKEHNVYGLIYTIEGTGAASPCQFFVTDSVANFVRGALYFNTTPNNDSLAPVIDFIKEDIQHLIKTFRWKKG